MKRKQKAANKGWYVLRLRGCLAFLKELGVSASVATVVAQAGVDAINKRFSGRTEIAPTEKS